MILRRLNLRSLPRVFIGSATVIFGLTLLQESNGPISILLAALISLMSALSTYLPFAMVCVSTFWIGRAEFLRDLFIELFVFQNYPLSEFPRAFIVVFSLAIPLIFSATVPVLVLTQWTTQRSLGVLFILICIISLQMFLFWRLWNRGLKRYESFGG